MHKDFRNSTNAILKIVMYQTDPLLQLKALKCPLSSLVKTVLREAFTQRRMATCRSLRKTFRAMCSW